MKTLALTAGKDPSGRGAVAEPVTITIGDPDPDLQVSEMDRQAAEAVEALCSALPFGTLQRISVQLQLRLLTPRTRLLVDEIPMASGYMPDLVRACDAQCCGRPADGSVTARNGMTVYFCRTHEEYIRHHAKIGGVPR